MTEEIDPERRLQSSVVFERVKHAGVHDDGFRESIEILDGRGYIYGEEVYGGAIPFFTVSIHTFGEYLRKTFSGYEALVHQVAVEIVDREMRNSKVIAAKLAEPEVHVAHVFAEMEAAGLIRQERLFRGPRVITHISAELRRRLRAE